MEINDPRNFAEVHSPKVLQSLLMQISRMFVNYNLMFCISIVAFTNGIGVILADIILDSDEPGEQTREPINDVEKDEIKLQNNNICHMEVEIKKRIIGYCIKHGLASHSCVADGYLHPFHSECLSSG